MSPSRCVASTFEKGPTVAHMAEKSASTNHSNRLHSNKVHSRDVMSLSYCCSTLAPVSRRLLVRYNPFLATSLWQCTDMIVHHGLASPPAKLRLVRQHQKKTSKSSSNVCFFRQSVAHPRNRNVFNLLLAFSNSTTLVPNYVNWCPIAVLHEGFKFPVLHGDHGNCLTNYAGTEVTLAPLPTMISNSRNSWARSQIGIHVNHHLNCTLEFPRLHETRHCDAVVHWMR